MLVSREISKVFVNEKLRIHLKPDRNQSILTVCAIRTSFTSLVYLFVIVFFQGGRSKNLLLAELGQELAAQRDSLNKRLQGN
mgnify:FL=1